MSLLRFHYGENNINTGPLKEIPEICIDHFWGDDLNSSVFFLSHAHTDHLVGLETEEFLRRLKQPGIKLYCHPLTPILLGSFGRYLGGPDGIKKLIAAQKIVPVDVKTPLQLRIMKRSGGALNVTVTLLPAGHCPGSVMFLFETPKYRILHTGDFRLEVEDLKRMSFLHDKEKVPKPIDHLYVDTTFCSKSATLFPNRKNVLEDTMQHIRDWINGGQYNFVDLRFAAKFAHEFALLKLNKVFGQKIHVTPERLEIYKNIPELYKIVTLDNRTQFHLCGSRNCIENGKPITVRFSSMWYTRGSKDQEDKEDILWSGRNMTLCYSMHSSLQEIAKTIDYLKPRIVTPLVLPKKSNLKEVENALRSATSTQFKFEDYLSSRNVFGEDNTPTGSLCPEERDNLYLEADVEEATDEKQNGNVREDGTILHQNDLQSSLELELPNSPEPKRPRLREELQNLWQFKFSPSPKSKSSQSSSDEASSQSTNGGSQEILTQNDVNVPGTSKSNNRAVDDFMNDPFLQPQPLVPRSKHNVRRNLTETVLKSFVSDSSRNCDKDLNTAENLNQCDINDGNNYEEDDIMENSQRL